MTGIIGQVALSNLVFAAVLAGLAYAVHRSGRHPGLAHVLWVLVLVKAVTPPFLLLPVVPGAAQADPGAATDPVLGQATVGSAATGSAGLDPIAGLLSDPAALLGVLWIVGSVAVLVGSVVRIRRFDRLLTSTSAPAPTVVVAIATDVARTLGLRSVPAIDLSSARVSPMTWWAGRRVRIVIPRALATGIDPEQLRLVLAHELAHVRRRDHLVRWLEWLARVVAWWNPVVWWAQRKLREAEELSCDALVLDRLDAGPRSYAHALLAVVEFLARPTTRQPALATGMGAGATLERRFRAIVSDARGEAAPVWLRVSLAAATFTLLVLGIGAAGPAEVSSPPSTAAPRVDAAGDPGAIPDDGYSFVSGTVDAPSAAERPWDDRSVGTSASDSLTGGGGRDLIDGRAGRDALSGGRGDDLIRGGPGRDTIDAGPGDDVVITWQDAQRDAVDCGAGDADRAVADAADVLVGCELISRREPVASTPAARSTRKRGETS